MLKMVLHRKGEKYCTHALMTSRKTDKMLDKSRKETPQKMTQLSSRSHPRRLVGKRTAQKDITIDTTSDSQVNRISQTGGHRLV